MADPAEVQIEEEEEELLIPDRSCGDGSANNTNAIRNNSIVPEPQILL